MTVGPRWRRRHPLRAAVPRLLSSPAHSRLTRESDDTACSAETPSAWRLDTGRRMFLSVPSHHSRPDPNPSRPTLLWYFPLKSCPSIINILPFYAPRPSGKAKERNQPLSQTRADSAKQTDVTSQAWCARRSFEFPHDEVATQLQLAPAETFERKRKEKKKTRRKIPELAWNWGFWGQTGNRDTT